MYGPRRREACGKRAGHGTDKKYCKAHARLHSTEKVMIYRAEWGYPNTARIYAHEVREITDSSVFDLLGRRHARSPRDHLTFESAKQWLIAQAKQSAVSYRAQLKQAEARLQAAKDLEEA